MSHSLDSSYDSEKQSSTSSTGQYGLSSRQAENNLHIIYSHLGLMPSLGSSVNSSVSLDSSGAASPLVIPWLMEKRAEYNGFVKDSDIERSTDIHIDRAREEGVAHENSLQFSNVAIPQRDVLCSSHTRMASYPMSSTTTSQGQRHSNFKCSSSLDWLLNCNTPSADDSKSPAPSKYVSASENKFNASRDGEYDKQSILGCNDGDYRFPNNLEPLVTSSQPKYTAESANELLSSLGLEKDDLEYLISYPEDQITPANLPFILRQIRIQKTKRTTAAVLPNCYPEPQFPGTMSGTDSQSLSSLNFAEKPQEELTLAAQPSDMFDYGHTGNYTGVVGNGSRKTSDSRTTESGSMMLYTCENSKHNQEPSQKSQSELENSVLGSSTDQGSPVSCLSSKHIPVRISATPPSYQQTKRLQTQLNLTSLTAYKSGASELAPLKEPETNRQSTLETQTQSTLASHIQSNKPDLIVNDAECNSKKLTKVPAQEMKAAEQLKKQQIKEQTEKQPVVKRSKQKKQQTQKRPVSQTLKAVLISHQKSSLHLTNRKCLQKERSCHRLSSPRRSLDRVSSPRRSLDRLSSPRRSLDRLSSPRWSLDRLSSPRRSLDRLSSPRRSLDRLSSPRRSLDRLSSPSRRRDRLSSPRRSLDRLSSSRRSLDRLSAPRERRDQLSSPRRSLDRLSSPRRSLDRLSSPRRSLDRLSSSRRSLDRLSAPRRTRDRQTSPRWSHVRVSSPRRSFDRLSSPRRSLDRLSSPRRSLDRLSSPRRSLDRLSSPRRSLDRLSSPRRSLDRVSSPRRSLDRLSSPRRSLDRLSSPRRSLDRLSSPRRSLDRLSSPRKSLDRLSSPRRSLDRLSSPRRSRDRLSSPRRRRDRLSSPRRSRDRLSSPRRRRDQLSSPRRSRDRLSSPRRSLDWLSSPRRSLDRLSSPRRSLDRLPSPRRGNDRPSSQRMGYDRPSSPRRGYDRPSSPRRGYNRPSSPRRGYNRPSLPRMGYDQASRASKDSAFKQKKPISAKSLAKKLLKASAVQSLSEQCDIEAMAKTLGSVILAELTKVKSASASLSSASSSPKAEEELLSTPSKSSSDLRKRQSGKSSPPTVVRLQGVDKSLSRNDVVTALEHYGRTKSVLLFRSKLQAVACYENEEDAKKLMTVESLNVKGLPVTVVRHKDEEKMPHQDKPSTSSVSNPQTNESITAARPRKVLLPTPKRPLFSGKRESFANILITRMFDCPGTATKPKVLMSKSKKISTRQLAKTIKAGKLPVKKAKKRQSTSSGSMLGTGQSKQKPTAETSVTSVTQSVVEKKETDATSTTEEAVGPQEDKAEIETSNVTSFKPQHQSELDQDAEELQSMQLEETGLGATEPMEVDIRESQTPSSPFETHPEDTKTIKQDVVTSVTTQADPSVRNPSVTVVSRHQAAASTSSEPGPESSHLTIGEMVEEHMNIERLVCINLKTCFTPKFLSHGPRVCKVLVTGLPPYYDGCYTEKDIVKMLIPLGFESHTRAIYVVPQMCMALVQISKANFVQYLKQEARRKNILKFKGHKIKLRVLKNDIDMTQRGMYIFLMKLMNSPVTCLGFKVVFIKNISPSEIETLREMVKKQCCIKNFLPLLNKVYIEFKTAWDADQFGICCNLLPKNPHRGVYRLRSEKISESIELPACGNTSDCQDVATERYPSAEAIPPKSTTPFWMTITTCPYLYPTSFPYFINPNNLTVNGEKDMEEANRIGSKIPTIMLTGFTNGLHKHEDVVKLLRPYFPKHNLDFLYYNVLVLPLQRRAFVFFTDWTSCCDFVRDHISKPVSVRNCTLTVHFVLEDMGPVSSEEMVYRTAMKWTSPEFPVSPPETLEDRLLCVEVSVTFVALIKMVINMIGSLATLVNFLPLSNKIYVEIADSRGITQVMKKIQGRSKKQRLWSCVLHIETLKSLKERLQHKREWETQPSVTSEQRAAASSNVAGEEDAEKPGPEISNVPTADPKENPSGVPQIDNHIFKVIKEAVRQHRLTQRTTPLFAGIAMEEDSSADVQQTGPKEDQTLQVLDSVNNEDKVGPEEFSEMEIDGTFQVLDCLTEDQATTDEVSALVQDDCSSTIKSLTGDAAVPVGDASEERSAGPPDQEMHKNDSQVLGSSCKQGSNGKRGKGLSTQSYKDLKYPDGQISNEDQPLEDHDEKLKDLNSLFTEQGTFEILDSVEEIVTKHENQKPGTPSCQISDENVTSIANDSLKVVDSLKGLTPATETESQSDGKGEKAKKRETTIRNDRPSRRITSSKNEENNSGKKQDKAAIKMDPTTDGGKKGTGTMDKMDFQIVYSVEDESVVDTSTNIERSGRRRSARGKKDEKITSTLTNIPDKPVEDEEATADEPTITTRSARGKMKKTVAPKKAIPTRRAKSARIQEQNKEQTKNKEADVTNESPNRSGISETEACEEDSTYKIFDSVEEVGKNNRPATGQKRKRGRPKKLTKKAKQDNAASKQVENDASKTVTDEEATSVLISLNETLVTLDEAGSDEKKMQEEAKQEDEPVKKSTSSKVSIKHEREEEKEPTDIPSPTSLGASMSLDKNLRSSDDQPEVLKTEVEVEAAAKADIDSTSSGADRPPELETLDGCKDEGWSRRDIKDVSKQRGDLTEPEAKRCRFHSPCDPADFKLPSLKPPVSDEGEKETELPCVDPFGQPGVKDDSVGVASAQRPDVKPAFEARTENRESHNSYCPPLGEKRIQFFDKFGTRFNDKDLINPNNWGKIASARQGRVPRHNPFSHMDVWKSTQIKSESTMLSCFAVETPNKPANQCDVRMTIYHHNHGPWAEVEMMEKERTQLLTFLVAPPGPVFPTLPQGCFYNGPTGIMKTHKRKKYM
ncbi:uncharacterized protein [Antennarius striatus]|uniref:uncharacterized protein isoform X2 n=1 Tax=Antennarius striatus TaxID=241820 RepID=UPI0035B1CD40